MIEDYDYNPMDEGFDHSGVDSGEFDDTYDFNDDDLVLGFVRYIGKEGGGINLYELIFTAAKNDFWGEGFSIMPSSICGYLTPDEKYIHKVVKIKTLKNLVTAQENSCFSMQDCLDGIIALCWEDLVGLSEYPEYRLILHFGEPYEAVENKLAQCHILMD